MSHEGMKPSSSRADLPGWVLTVPERSPSEQPVRIGDAERETAITTLGDHFAAGRLDREELDERISAAIGARYAADLEPLFADLPWAGPPAERSAAGSPPRPLAALAAVTALTLVIIVATVVGLVLVAPWLLWGLAWVLVIALARGRSAFGHTQPAAVGWRCH